MRPARLWQYLGLPSWRYRLQPAKAPPWATMTPLAPSLGISTSAVTACDLFFMLSTEFSLRRRMPPWSSWVLPLTRTGRPAMSELNRSMRRSSRGQHVVLDRFDQEQSLQLGQLVGMLSGEVVG